MLEGLWNAIRIKKIKETWHLLLTIMETFREIFEM